MLIRRIALLLAFICVSPVAAAGEIDDYLALIQKQLPAQAAAVLPKIDGAPRQLLAARAYLRAGDALERRWSWSAEQIAAYQQSPEYRALTTDIERVEARFAAQNPGYELYENTEVRSLDLQLQRWNSNRSVATVAQALHRDVLKEIASMRTSPDANNASRLAKFLQSWRPPVAASLATPGLSLHGQLRAIDFQVTKDGAIIAGTDVAAARRVWENSGWSKKLQAAIAGSRFRGPLQSPNEPWHYEYVP